MLPNLVCDMVYCTSSSTGSSRVYFVTWSIVLHHQEEEFIFGHGLLYFIIRRRSLFLDMVYCTSSSGGGVAYFETRSIVLHQEEEELIL
ncbi:hypothetical protein CDAR_69661 [Caerostris darwini]|uniref:Uncharacterized protein n=1 Tax=Caerostris darwini TaxID=1538125 RepID=A0AAV4U0U3_9ARAC|nr:hypothetical protein CDAR_69661 [Caerostris darwini]